MSNIINTHGLQQRLDELQGLKETLEEAVSVRDDLEKQLAEASDDTDIADLEKELADAANAVSDAESDFSTEEEEELDELETLESEIPEFRNGETMIPVDEFEDYAKELLEDCGDLPEDLPSYIVIDWEETAKNLLMDYTEVTYQGENYYVRNC